MNITGLHSSLDEEVELDIFLLLFGVSMVPMGGIFVLFDLAIVSALWDDCFFENKYS